MRFMVVPEIGFGTLLKRSAAAFNEDKMTVYASALAFHSLFSMFPFFLFLLALLGFLHLESFFDWLRLQAELVLPPVAVQQINPVIDQLQQQQTGLLSFGILLALLSASKGVRFLMLALNVVYGVEEARPWWQLIILSLLYTLGLAVLMLTASGLMIFGPQIVEWTADQIGLQQLVVVLWTWLRWPAALLLLMVSVAVIYYVAPDVQQRFRFITPGSVLAVIVWLLGSLGFGAYVQNVVDYSATYGSIGAIIVLLMYLYLSTSVLLFGAELNAVIEHSSREGKDEGEKALPDDE